MRLVLAAGLGFVMSGCARPPAVVDGKRIVQFGEQCYAIPLWNAALINASPMWPGYRRRDSVRSLSLQFATSDFEQAIDHYHVVHDVQGQPRESVIAGLFLRTPEEIEQQRQNVEHSHVDLWYGLGDFGARTIEYVPELNLYRVYPLAGGVHWMVVTREPDVERRDTHLSADFWVGTCHDNPPPRESSCITHGESGALDVTLHTTEANIPLRQQMTQLIVSKLEIWRTPCTR